jgi:hypothetical protein
MLIVYLGTHVIALSHVYLLKSLLNLEWYYIQASMK